MEVMPFVAASQGSPLQHAKARGNFASVLRCGGAESGGYPERIGHLMDAEEVNSHFR